MCTRRTSAPSREGRNESGEVTVLARLAGRTRIVCSTLCGSVSRWSQSEIELVERDCEEESSTHLGELPHDLTCCRGRSWSRSTVGREARVEEIGCDVVEDERVQDGDSVAEVVVEEGEGLGGSVVSSARGWVEEVEADDVLGRVQRDRRLQS